MDLLDLMNYVKNGRRVPEITPSNVRQYYSLANTVTLNGIYFYQYLSEHGFEPVIIQNYATCNISDFIEEDTLAVCISSNFIFMNDIKDIAVQIKEMAPELPVIAGGMLVKKVLDGGERFSKKTLEYLGEYRGKVDGFVIEAMGEESLVKLLQCMQDGAEPCLVPNVAYFDSRGASPLLHGKRSRFTWIRPPFSGTKFLKNIPEHFAAQQQPGVLLPMSLLHLPLVVSGSSL